MKKFIMLSAVMAAVSTAFVACSSDDDLAQAPAVPEETVSEGIPFSVVAFNTDDTRAVRYDANGDGWEPTTGTTPVAATGNSAFVKSFKLYGKQADASDVWINNLIFARTAKSGDGSKFVPSRLSNNETYTGTLTWPTENTDKATTFYAITDNDIPTTGDNTNLTGVNWNPAAGTFTYTVPQAASTNVGIVEYSNSVEFITVNKNNVVDADALRDLMVATATKTAAADPANAVSLTFNHVMSGLAINAWLVTDNDAVPASVDIKAVMVCGLKGYSTYTFGSGFGEKTIPVIYYKQFVTDVTDLSESGIVLNKQTMSAWDNPAKVQLVAPGEWLVIPQTCTPWDRYADDDSDFPGMSGAFVSILLDDGNASRLMSFPLTTNAAHKLDKSNTTLSDMPASIDFNVGFTRTLNLNVALGREHYLGPTPSTPHVPAQLPWAPAEVTTP